MFVHCGAVILMPTTIILFVVDGAFLFELAFKYIYPFKTLFLFVVDMTYFAVIIAVVYSRFVI